MDIEGTYKVKLSAPFGGSIQTRFGEMMLKKEVTNGRFLSGTMCSAFLWHPATFCGGSFDDDGNFSFTAYFSTPAQQCMMSVSGKVVQDTVTGKVETPIVTFDLTGTRKE